MRRHSSVGHVVKVVLLLSSFAATAVEAENPDPGLAARVAVLESRISALEATVATLRSAIATLERNPMLALGPYVSVVPGEVDGLKGPHVMFTGANVHVRSGSGSTDDGFYSSGKVTGLGNLIVGYNEQRSEVAAGRTGAHNLVVGSGHGYSSFGGLLAGTSNTVTRPSATVSGGSGNVNDADFGSISGGESNTVSSSYASVGGGQRNRAIADFASVTGGENNTADEPYRTVCGGNDGTAAARLP